jgi:uncharacterized membrane protein YczE
VLGGNVGAGTLVAALAIGPLVQPLMPLFTRLPWSLPGSRRGRGPTPAAA